MVAFCSNLFLSVKWSQFIFISSHGIQTEANQPAGLTFASAIQSSCKKSRRLVSQSGKHGRPSRHWCLVFISLVKKEAQVCLTNHRRMKSTTNTIPDKAGFPLSSSNFCLGFAWRLLNILKSSVYLHCKVTQC